MGATDSKKVEEALRESEQRYRAVVEDMPGMVCRFLPDGTLTFVSNSCCDYFKKTNDEMIGNNLYLFIAEDDRAKVRSHLMSLNQERPMVTCEHRMIAPEGDIRWQQWTYRALFDEQGLVTEYQSVGRDITDDKRAQDEKVGLERQLQQAQRMEAIGSLAGGVAHDFNNLLTAIQGYTAMAMMKTRETDPLYIDLKQVSLAAGRAADLTRQLLLFSRRQPTQPTLLNVNKTVNNLLGMLKPLIGEDIAVISDLEPHLWTVRADEGNLEQVIVNLAVNARDAMPQGGKLTIKTQNVYLDEADCKAVPEAKPGRAVRLSIADTGDGIDQGTIQRIFEPFFSTKEAGRGTGLGLAVVYGIVKRHGGFMNVWSEPGKGATFEVYLPFFAAELKEETEETIHLEDLRGSEERILLVEDDDAVRSFAATALRENGYHVFEAATVREALDIFDKEDSEFHLVLTDVVLPDRNGLELVDELLSRKPELLVLLSSGYTDDKSQWDLIREKGFHFLQKPYGPADLLRTVREVLQEQ